MGFFDKLAGKAREMNAEAREAYERGKHMDKEELMEAIRNCRSSAEKLGYMQAAKEKYGH